MLSKAQKDAIERIMVNEIIQPFVIKIRERCKEQFHTDDKTSPHYKYTGLCDFTSDVFVTTMGLYFDEEKDKSDEIHKLITEQIRFGVLHGEQKHKTNLPSKYWAAEHTWCYVKIAGVKIYVDITSEQFQKFYKDIPNYYISTKKPKWYYEDKRNPLWLILHQVNKLKKIWKPAEKLFNPTFKVITFLQYRIWGSISDWIYIMK